MSTVNKTKIREFVDRWTGRGQENEDTQQFWLQLLRAIGYNYCDSVLFEKRVSNGGQIDVWLREVDVLIEQKSLNIDLDRPEPRQGKMKKPLQQALDYAEDIRLSDQPKFIITCNFKTFRVYDRSKYGRSELERNVFEFSLEELFHHPEYLGFITNPENSRLEKEKEVSIRAGELIGQLYDMLLAAYYDSDNEQTLVLKGSKLSATISDAPTFRGRKTIEKAREGCVVNNILQKDLAFKSPSTAGNVVTGRSTDGLQAWKTEDGKVLKEALSK